jgi:hypothetical protein
MCMHLATPALVLPAVYGAHGMFYVSDTATTAQHVQCTYQLVGAAYCMHIVCNSNQLVDPLH